jgi:hypothetical protein
MTILHELRNIKETRRAACNTGNTDLHRSPVSAIVMPGYSLPPTVVQVPKSVEKKVKQLTKRFNKGELAKLLQMLES